ncbi:hypothetical protein D4768_21255 [Rhodococcus erythropolis]|uniref:hypothetical protein n=1 Tax=Rhodococcus erythropolis TaxID=1833 RepID=UPI001F2846E6|nr:hypothetical protein [Rhodococcus erythropolis]UJC79925.1 hypothetical protein D4768_21255 [Rhodococcus erythropolis]
MTTRDETPAPSVDQITAWFAALGSGARRILFAGPRAEISTEFVDEILTKGRKLAGPWFSESTTADELHLPDDVADYVDGLLAELQGWWIGLSNDQRLRWADVESSTVPDGLQTAYPGLFEFVVGDEGTYADPQVVDFIAVAAA